MPHAGHREKNGSSYGALIEAQRQAARMTLTELAARVGIPTQTLALWEDPLYEGVDLSILQRVARATGSELEISFCTAVRSQPAWKQLLQSTQP